MKKQPTTPSRKKTLQSIIDYLVDNGVSDFNANMFIHTNILALGEHKNIVDTVREENWELAWNVVELYINGDLF